MIETINTSLVTCTIIIKLRLYKWNIIKIGTKNRPKKWNIIKIGKEILTLDNIKIKKKKKHIKRILLFLET